MMVIVHTIVNNEVIMITDDYKYVSSNNYTIHINKIIAAGGEIYTMIILIIQPQYKNHYTSRLKYRNAKKTSAESFFMK